MSACPYLAFRRCICPRLVGDTNPRSFQLPSTPINNGSTLWSPESGRDELMSRAPSGTLTVGYHTIARIDEHAILPASEP